MPRQTIEDLLSPERIYYRLIKDYISGRLTDRRIISRARVEQVDPVGGQLESLPPNPPNSIKARIYTSALDVNIPSFALTVFHPLLPPHLSPPVDVGEHVYVLFEDSNYSNGIWISTVGVYESLNYSSPEENKSPPAPTAADKFNSRQLTTPEVDIDLEYGGKTIKTANTERMVRAFSEESSLWAGKRILHIGDSQVAGPFGDELGNTLREKGATFYHRDGRVSWGVSQWLRGIFNGRASATNVTEGPLLPQLINNHQPDIVLITLGGNDSFRANNPNYPSQVEQLWAQAKEAADYYWIAPPTAVGRAASRQPGRSAVANIIKGIVKDKFIESRDVTNISQGRSGDGVHFNYKNLDAVRPWIERVANR